MQIKKRYINSEEAFKRACKKNDIEISTFSRKKILNVITEDGEKLSVNEKGDLVETAGVPQFSSAWSNKRKYITIGEPAKVTTVLVERKTQRKGPQRANTTLANPKRGRAVKSNA